MAQCTELDFVDLKNGWAIARSTTGDWRLYRIRDGGHTWTRPQELIQEREIFKVAFDRYRGRDYTHTTGGVPHRRYVRSGRHAPWRVEPDWARAVSPSKCTAARSAARSSFSVRTDAALIALVTRLHPELDAGKKGACTVIPVLDTAAKGGHS